MFQTEKASQENGGKPQRNVFEFGESSGGVTVDPEFPVSFLALAGDLHRRARNQSTIAEICGLVGSTLEQPQT